MRDRDQRDSKNRKAFKREALMEKINKFKKNNNNKKKKKKKKKKKIYIYIYIFFFFFVFFFGIILMTCDDQLDKNYC